MTGMASCRMARMQKTIGKTGKEHAKAVGPRYRKRRLAMSDYSDQSYDYDSFYDFDGDGTLDSGERMMKDDDDDYFYYHNSKDIPGGHAYRPSSGSAKSNSGGLSLGKSAMYSLLIGAVVSSLLGTESGYAGAVIWIVMTLLLYFCTNAK